MRWKLITLLTLSILLVIFAVQNYEVVSIQFLFWSFQTSRALILLGTFIIGVLVGVMTAFMRGKQSQTRKSKKNN